MPRDIGIDELDRLVSAGAQLIEVLPAVEFDEEHLPGAIDVVVMDERGIVVGPRAPSFEVPKSPQLWRTSRSSARPRFVPMSRAMRYGSE